MTRVAASGSRRFLGARGIVLVLLVACGLAAWIALDAPLGGLVPHGGGWKVVRGFFAHALSPALTYESDVPAETPPILVVALAGARRTIVFAAAGMSLALVLGVVLGFLGSTAWWSGVEPRGRTRIGRAIRRAIGPTTWGVARGLIVALRSVHELLWAVVFLAAFGLNTFSAVVAIALPYGGTLAKIFSEMLDESPRDAALALRGLGATPLAETLFGLVPRALPDMSAYACYRFECAVRSAAVLGFFGFQTLGYSIAQAFENLHYGEVWTYLYALGVVVVAIELWSASVRARFVA